MRALAVKRRSVTFAQSLICRNLQLRVQESDSDTDNTRLMSASELAFDGVQKVFDAVLVQLERLLKVLLSVLLSCSSDEIDRFLNKRTRHSKVIFVIAYPRYAVKIIQDY